MKKKAHTSVLTFTFTCPCLINGCHSEVMWLSNRIIFLALKQNDNMLVMDAFNKLNFTKC
jgi:hypothetical protein